LHRRPWSSPILKRQNHAAPKKKDIPHPQTSGDFVCRGHVPSECFSPGFDVPNRSSLPELLHRSDHSCGNIYSDQLGSRPDGLLRGKQGLSPASQAAFMW